MDHYDPAADWKAVVKDSINFTLEDLSFLLLIATTLMAVYSIMVYFGNAGNAVAFYGMGVLWIVAALVGIRVAVPLIIYWGMVALSGLFLLLGYMFEWMLAALKKGKGREASGEDEN